jgi:hypothetical protein
MCSVPSRTVFGIHQLLFRCMFQWGLELLPPEVEPKKGSRDELRATALLEDEENEGENEDDADSIDEEMRTEDADRKRNVTAKRLLACLPRVVCVLCRRDASRHPC